MALNYEYAYAEIDPSTGMCIGVITSSSEADHPNFIRIPEYNENYFLKYYINGAWYEDPSGTIPFTP